jgi:hypothetical protein
MDPRFEDGSGFDQNFSVLKGLPLVFQANPEADPGE